MLGFRGAQPGFSGYGKLLWRNSRHNYIGSGGDSQGYSGGQTFPAINPVGAASAKTPLSYNSPIMMCPIGASLQLGTYGPNIDGINQGKLFIKISRTGHPVWPQSGATYQNTDFTRTSLRMIEIEGYWTQGQTVGRNTHIQYDMHITGQYELDPTSYWAY
jgi:hypothetical protein